MRSETGDKENKMFGRVWEMADNGGPVKLTAKVCSSPWTFRLRADAQFDFKHKFEHRRASWNYKLGPVHFHLCLE